MILAIGSCGYKMMRAMIPTARDQHPENGADGHRHDRGIANIKHRKSAAVESHDCAAENYHAGGHQQRTAQHYSD
jgi:hypothetical protein